MKNITIAAAQCQSVRGNIDANIEKHLEFIREAALRGVDLLVFPELSLTGYELDLAGGLQFAPDDSRLDPIRNASVKYGIRTIVGVPWDAEYEKPLLGAFLFGSESVTCYAKIHVHESELPYFIAGSEHCVVSVNGVQTALAICADTSHESHAAEAAARGADLYLASVMKTTDEMRAHEVGMAGYAKQHRMAVLTVNHARSSDQLNIAGGSTIWDERGQAVVRADTNEEALVLAEWTNGNWSGRVLRKS